MIKEGIKIEGHYGTWFVIDESYFNGTKHYLLESEIYGDEAPAIIVTHSMRTNNLIVVMDDVQDGFSDLFN